MSKTKAVSTHAGICAVCFGEFKLDTTKGRTDKPTRHGFTANNVRHGQTGGWHSGPCPGYSFPHYGQSVEGTKYALGRVTHQRDTIKLNIEHHATRPTLIWTRPVSKTWGRVNPAHKPVDFEVKPGDERKQLPRDPDNGFTYSA